MTIWLDDLLDQISTAIVLAESGTETGKRLSFIIVDNAVEYLMKAYVESEARLVGQGMGKKIAKSDWEKKKRNFEDVLDFVYVEFKINASKTDILSYHNVRNKLYHDGLPISVNLRTIYRYMDQLKLLLKDLHDFEMTNDQWIKAAHDISKLIVGEEAKSSRNVIKYINQNGLIRFETDLSLADTVAISHAINAFSNNNGTEPSVEDIEIILAMSGHPLEGSVIRKRLDHLRSSGKLLLTKRLLKPSSVNDLKKKFVIHSVKTAT